MQHNRTVCISLCFYDASVTLIYIIYSHSTYTYDTCTFNTIQYNTTIITIECKLQCNDYRTNSVCVYKRYVIRCGNSVLSNFRNCSYGVKYQLFRSYCTSFCGYPFWNVSDKHVNNFYISWRKVSERYLIYHIKHIVILPIISECRPIQCQLLCRMSKCIYNALSTSYCQ